MLLEVSCTIHEQYGAILSIFRLFKNLSYTLFFFLFSFLAAPMSYGSSRPEFESELLLQPTLQLQQCQTLNRLRQARDGTHATSETMLGP